MLTARFALASILVLLAALLLLAGGATPAHSDQAAFAREMDLLLGSAWDDDLRLVNPDSEAFFAIHARYWTPRWLLLDSSYSAVGWSLLAGLVGAVSWRRVVARQRRLIGLVPVLGVALVLLGLGLVAGPIHQVERDQVPIWADSLGIPFYGAVAVMRYLTPVLVVAVFSPLLRRTVEGPILLIAKPRRPLRLLAVALSYAGPLCLALVLILSFWSPGGWALSTAGWLLAWLLVNAAGLWMAPAPARTS